MKHVIIAKNPFEPSSYAHYETNNLFELLREQFGDRLPETAHIYHNYCAERFEVTPYCEADIERLRNLEGTFYVVDVPATPLQVIQLVLLIVLSTVSMLLTPKITQPQIPNVAQRNIQSSSPNNELSARTNQARVAGRIPDIFGTVRSTPDLISVPYITYVNHTEVEDAYMCVGRGEYTISADDIKDGDTLVSEIAGATVEIYAPDTSPNSAEGTQLIIGSPISDPLLAVHSVTSVNGQVLRAMNSQTFTGTSNIRFVYPDTIECNDTNVRLDDYFGVGDSINITSAVDGAIDLLGTYEIISVGSSEIGLSNPAAVNTDWNDLSALPEQATNYISPTLIVGYALTGSANIRFVNPATIETNDVGIDFSSQISAGDTVTVSLATGELLNLNGVYVTSVTNVTVNTITLDNPQTVNAAWTTLSSLVGQATDYISPTIVGGLGTQIGASDIRFVYPNLIETIDPSGIDFMTIVALGDNVTITNAEELYDLAGTYDVLDTTASLITLDSPAVLNDDWTNILIFVGGATTYISPALVSHRPAWVGPFTIDVSDLDRVVTNFVAINGLYKDSGTAQYGTDVTVELELTPLDSNGDEIGAAELFQATVVGSGVTRSTRAITLQAVPTFTGPCSMRARRVTDTDKAFVGTVIDEVKWRNAYGASLITDNDFGNITTVRTRTYATAGALAVKERKLNMIVTRNIPARYGATEMFTTTLSPSTSAADIFCAIALDPYIGGRDGDELDVANIYTTVAAVVSYFGTSEAAQFCYTFDKQNMSFEETAAAVAQAVFCTAYRRGHQIKMSFEKETNDYTLLFNHRNKIPKSEVLTVGFGAGGAGHNFDGVSYQYVDPTDDSIATYYIPEDRSAISPQKVESIGVRSDTQAYLQAWRIYQKQVYQHIVTEFDALQLADLLVINDRILVADNTRTGTLDGYVVEQNVLDLTLSQEADLDPALAYTIFLQHIDGTIESLVVTGGSTPYHVTLGGAPASPLSLDQENAARATYQIVADNSSRRSSAFLVMERTPKDNFTSNVKAMNYDSRYYLYDVTGACTLNFSLTANSGYVALIEDI
ncbi:MAG: host specificity factor TipJ family phage tail protein [Armatimonadota bacterium]|nr:host specificity factor TipJ family phage tail protein [Armatimonadota bacterium]